VEVNSGGTCGGIVAKEPQKQQNDCWMRGVTVLNPHPLLCGNVLLLSPLFLFFAPSPSQSHICQLSDTFLRFLILQFSHLACLITTVSPQCPLSAATPRQYTSIPTPKTTSRNPSLLIRTNEARHGMYVRYTPCIRYVLPSLHSTDPSDGRHRRLTD
jgi:hypothetical protein